MHSDRIRIDYNSKIEDEETLTTTRKAPLATTGYISFLIFYPFPLQN